MKNARTSLALAALVVLMGTSVAFVLLPSAAGRSSLPSSLLPPGSVLAMVKILALAFLFLRIRRADLYTMQWSSMFILLFFAEGIVRAVTDPRPLAIAGGVEACAATVLFLVVLAVLRPIKRQAKDSARGR